MNILNTILLPLNDSNDIIYCNFDQYSHSTLDIIDMDSKGNLKLRRIIY